MMIYQDEIIEEISKVIQQSVAIGMSKSKKLEDYQISASRQIAAEVYFRSIEPALRDAWATGKEGMDID